MLGDMLGRERRLAPHARSSFGRFVHGAADRSIRGCSGLSIFVVAEHPARPPIRAAISRSRSSWLSARSPPAPGFISRNTAFAVIGPVPGGLPSLRLPDVTWSETLAVLPVAMSCFVMIIAQSAATSRVYAIRHQGARRRKRRHPGPRRRERRRGGQRSLRRQRQSDADRDGGWGGRAKPGRAARLRRVVLVVLLFLTGPLQYLPRCVLASIVFTIAVGMVDVRGPPRHPSGEPRRIHAGAPHRRGSAAIGVEQGILLAIGFSLVRHVRHSYRPHTMVLVPDASGRWEPAPAQPGLADRPRD